MAADDRYLIAPASVANTAYMTIQPGTGVEAIIKNIFCAAAAEIHLYDGANDILLDTSALSGQNVWLNLSIDVTNTVYLRVKNVSGSAQIMSAGGVQTK